jgi:hypothetical protein
LLNILLLVHGGLARCDPSWGATAPSTSTALSITKRRPAFRDVAAELVVSIPAIWSASGLGCDGRVIRVSAKPNNKNIKCKVPDRRSCRRRGLVNQLA